MANLLFATSRCIRYSYPTVTRVRWASTDNTRPTVDFSDARKALKSKSTIDLIKSYLIYSLFKYDIFVDNSFKIMKLTRRLLGPSLFLKFMKATVYGQFAAGENNQAIKVAFEKFHNIGVRSVLNYSVEEDESTSNDGSSLKTKSIYDNSATVLMDSINLTSNLSKDNEGMIAIKLTGLCPTPVLSSISKYVIGGETLFTILADTPSLLEGHINEESFTKGMDKMGVSLTRSSELWNELSSQNKSLDICKWKRQITPQSNIYRQLSATKNCSHLIPLLSDSEVTEFSKALDRIDSLSQRALERNVRILVDAEQTYYNPAIEYITIDRQMRKYNLNKPVLYMTQQCYLKRTVQRLLLHLHMADMCGFHYGIKIVRGAYMEQERNIAIEKGYDNPVWDTKSETNTNYYNVLEIMMNRIKGTLHDSIVVASHNEDTIHFAMDKMEQQGLSKTDGRIVFGQVMGMADHLAPAIGSAGYMAYKYMPYGPVEEVLPYLARRANENRGMLIGPVRERRILAKEIKRRLTDSR